MSSQTQFLRALRDATRPVPPGLLGRWGLSAGKRFDVYRNNVTVSLQQALREGYPATAQLLGDKNFAAIAAGYVARHPPRNPLMYLYGDRFGAYLAQVPPLAHLGYLPDVAALEWHMRQAYHAADAAPLDPARLQTLAPEALLSTRLVFAPAVRLLRSHWPVAAIRAFALGHGEAPKDGPQSVLITRPRFDPDLTPLSDTQAALFDALQQGHTIGAALDIAPCTDPSADLSALLPVLIRTGAITALRKDTTP